MVCTKEKLFVHCFQIELEFRSVAIFATSTPKIQTSAYNTGRLHHVASDFHDGRGLNQTIQAQFVEEKNQ